MLLQKFSKIWFENLPNNSFFGKRTHPPIFACSHWLFTWCKWDIVIRLKSLRLHVRKKAQKKNYCLGYHLKTSINLRQKRLQDYNIKKTLCFPIVETQVFPWCHILQYFDAKMHFPSRSSSFNLILTWSGFFLQKYW